MLNSRITVTGNWDDSYTLNLDGEPVYERKTRAECDARANWLDAKLAIDNANPNAVESSNEKPTA